MAKNNPPRFCDDPLCSLFNQPMTGKVHRLTTCEGKPVYDGPNPMNYMLNRIEENVSGFRLMKSKGFLLKSQYQQALDIIDDDLRRLRQIVAIDKNLKYDEDE